MNIANCKQFFTFILIGLCVFQSSTCSGQQQQQVNTNIARKSNATTINVYASNSTDALETSPTITSVHQVWTSSSSGSLNELSPEVISKLRNDVPFLAAYALRPRLVGAGSSGEAAMPTGSSIELAPKSLDAGAASSPQWARQSLLPRLGDFSELKVETSSLSKSEHHHKRKTSLKRRQEDEDDQPGLGRRSAEQTRPVGSKAGRSTKQRRAAAKRRTSARASGRLTRAKANKRAKNGRLLQQPKGKDEDVEDVMGSIERDQTGAGDVKGGKPAGGTRRPFYASSGRPNAADGDKAAGDETGDQGKQPAITTSSPNTDDNDLDDDSGAIDDEPREPKRVGDDDVEEDGDTVLVEPKSDGVDDDPPLPTEADEEPDKPTTDLAGKDNELDDGNEPPKEAGVAAEGDERGKRVNRERPNQVDSTGQSAVGAGGIGATTGGGSSGNAGREDNSADDDDDQDDRRGPTSGSDRPRGRSEVEFADDQDKDKGDDGGNGGNGKGRSDDRDERTGGSKSDGADRTDGDQDDFGRRQKRPGADRDDKRVDGGSGGGAKDDSADPDLDYRDDQDGGTRKAPNPGAARGGHKADAGDEDDRVRSQDGPAKKPSDSSNKSNNDCDDGSYKHHDEKYHDDHHQTIDWLRGSIPGEPGEDYPILSRVNSTTFNCRDQKHPGYYADVDTRCQVFHICQADGRQDSFLCPNGTIFSQKTLVCVWWNGFDCEDAPKYYHLNALLYKRPSTDGIIGETPQSAALPDADSDAMGPLVDGAKPAMKTPYLKPKGMSVASRGQGSGLNDDEEDASIDSLIRAMKRRPKEMAELSPEDEATIQRKSTSSLDDNSDQPATSSRLRSSKSIPRRKRRASNRQAPPKLKSRRVSRNSRRRKLRHGIKPKRRA